jgi:hypothetical protein
MRFFFAICGLICFNISTFAQVDTLRTIEQTVMDIYSMENDSLEVFYKTSSIPKSLKKELRIMFGDFKIVSFNEDYRKTDVVRNPVLPNKQMLFLIQKDDYYALVFRKGGRALSTYFVFAKIVSKKVVDMHIYTISNKIETVDNFLLNISSGKFYSADWLLKENQF